MHDSSDAKRQIALLDRVVGGCGSRVQRLAFIGSQRRDYAACLPTINIFCETVNAASYGCRRLMLMASLAPRWRAAAVLANALAICRVLLALGQWLLYDDVERVRTVLFEAHLALHTASVEQPTVLGRRSGWLHNV